MKFAFVIDDDPKIFEEIKEALEAVDPKLGVRHYKSLEAFVDWLRKRIDKKNSGATSVPPAAATPDSTKPDPQAEQSKPEAPAEAPPASAPAAAAASESDEGLELALVICKNEFIGHRGFGLLQKTRDYFFSTGISTPENPTNFVVTAFDEDHFDYSRYENQIVSNIIFKPFDKSILKSHLRISLSGGKAEKSAELYTQKADSRIEMLKDVHLKSVNELGFESYSDREIPVGTLSKYYGNIFQAGRTQSVYAKCVSCRAEKSEFGSFVGGFEFFNISNQQVSALRRTIKADKSFSSLAFPTPDAFDYHFVVLAPKDVPSVKSTIEGSFKNATMHVYNDFLNFLYDADPNAGGQSKEKALPASPCKVFFDLKQSKVIAIEPPPSDTAVFLGNPAKATIDKDNPFPSRVFSDDKTRWLTLARELMPSGKEPQVFRFSLGADKLAFLKVSAFASVKHEKLGEVMAMDIAECSKEEQRDFLLKQSQLPPKIHAIFLDRIFMSDNPNERWKALLDILKDRAPEEGIRLFVTTGQEISTDELIEKNAFFEDVFLRPFDGPYVAKRLRRSFVNLNPQEEMEIATRPVTELIKAASPVKAKEISESGLSIYYPRAIQLGNFRKVVLWMPHEMGLPEFLVSCNAVEEVEEEKEKSYICHFLFFGVRDASLKHIRRWIKEFYVHTKESEG